MSRLAVITIVAAGCGRLGFDPVDGVVGPDAPASIGEELSLPPGWTADVWFDFSSQFTYDPNQYPDDPHFYTNRPHRIVLLDAPFLPGVALVASLELLELREPDVLVRHAYHRVLGANVGPDVIWDVAPCGTWMAAGNQRGLCVGAGSQSGGDGLFRIEADWSIRLIDPINNVGDLAYDEAGAFDAVATPQLYYGGPSGLTRYETMSNVHGGDHNGAFTEIATNGDLLTVTLDTSAMWTLARISSVSHTETVLGSITQTVRRINDQNAAAYAIASNTDASLPGIGYVIVDGKRLAKINANNTLTDLATTDAAGPWLWSHATFVPSSHSIADGVRTFLVLEVDPIAERNRVLRLRLP